MKLLKNYSRECLVQIAKGSWLMGEVLVVGTDATKQQCRRIIVQNNNWQLKTAPECETLHEGKGAMQKAAGK